jgi:hypothetical protein
VTWLPAGRKPTFGADSTWLDFGKLTWLWCNSVIAHIGGSCPVAGCTSASMPSLIRSSRNARTRNRDHCQRVPKACWEI